MTDEAMTQVDQQHLLRTIRNIGRMIEKVEPVVAAAALAHLFAGTIARMAEHNISGPHLDAAAKARRADRSEGVAAIATLFCPDAMT